MSTRLRTPLTYHGGKQRLSAKIVSIIPEDHISYIETFGGGFAVAFAKKPSEIEVFNDTNAELINFFNICKNRFHDLAALIRVTLLSRKIHDDANVIYNKPHLFDEVRRAWAVWVLSTQSFKSALNGNWGYDKTKSHIAKTVKNKRERFAEEIAFRLQGVHLECADALYIISSRDTPEAFFYCDPPYVGTDCGHYDGYSEQDYENLLIALSKIKGRFLLSSYPSELLAKFSKEFKWYSWRQESQIAISPRVKKKKIEVVTGNYKFTGGELMK